MPTTCIYDHTAATHEVPDLAFDGDRRRYPTLVCDPHAAEHRASGERVITLAERTAFLAVAATSRALRPRNA